MSQDFLRYIGIDYSGAETPKASNKHLRIYEADRLIGPVEVEPPRSPRKYWTRRDIAKWLVKELSQGPPILVGIDHGFSFPLQYFERYGLPHNWPLFLDDFQRHWPTDEVNTYVEFVRDGSCGNAAAPSGDSTWRRISELRSRAKSVFHFDVPGSVAKSTHAGLPWLRYLRNQTAEQVHSGRSKDGSCQPANRWLQRSTRRCGATPSPVRVIIRTSTMPIQLRNGCAVAILTARLMGFSTQAFCPTNEKWLKSRAGYWAWHEQFSRSRLLRG